MENRIFHIVFKEKKQDHMSKGVNVVAVNISTAIYKFGLKHYSKDELSIIAIYDINALADIKGGHPVSVEEDIAEFSNESGD